jgi:peptidyl-dipeptidase Dcp
MQPINNPLLQPWDTPFGLPPFERIRAEHFMPAFEVALSEHAAEVAAIAEQADAPTFENTLAALDRSGRRLSRIERLFFNLAASETSPALQAVEREVAPRLAAHESGIFLNARLFVRIDALHRQCEQLGLGGEQRRLLERVHLDFVRAGATLSSVEKERFGQIVERLAQLETYFSQNVLADESGWVLWLRTESELAGLPASVRDAARSVAEQRGEPMPGPSRPAARRLFHS